MLGARGAAVGLQVSAAHGDEGLIIRCRRSTGELTNGVADPCDALLRVAVAAGAQERVEAFDAEELAVPC
jgi:hypothetical protein